MTKNMLADFIEQKRERVAALPNFCDMILYDPSVTVSEAISPDTEPTM